MESTKIARHLASIYMGPDHAKLENLQKINEILKLYNKNDIKSYKFMIRYLFGHHALFGDIMNVVKSKKLIEYHVEFLDILIEKEIILSLPINTIDYLIKNNSLVTTIYNKKYEEYKKFVADYTL